MDGILVIDKPQGITSHDVVAHARRILHERRIGHTGTLDPFATGVLVLLVGVATRLARFLTGAVKEYHAVIRLGFETDTGDLTGQPLPGMTPAGSDVAELLALNRIESALASLRGPIDQTPPMYSAKKRGGRKLYELARRGETVQLDPIKVHIHQLELIEPAVHKNPDGSFELTVRVVCSAGAYIRVLATDFGRLLGCGAHLAELRRLRAGDFSLEGAKTLEQLQQLVKEKPGESILLPPDAALTSFPSLRLNRAQIRKAECGMALLLADSSVAGWADGEQVKINDEEGKLVAIGVYDSSGRLLRPRVVLAGGQNRR